MLEALRNASKNWLGKIVLTFMFGLLILSFAVWGIGDIFRGFGSGTVATAGKVEIPTEEYRVEYQTVLQNLQRQLRRVITNDQARAEGIDKLVLNRMISEGLLDRRAKELGLAMNYEAIAKGVMNDPQFKSPAGTFDRLAFQRALSDAGLNEQRFLDKQRSTYLRQQLVNSFAESLPVPRTMLEILHRLALETRSVDYFVLTAASAGDIPKPTDKDLETFFNSRKSAYRAPAYRKLVTLTVTPASLAKPEQISDDEARKSYDAIKATKYTSPEKRQVQQIVFKPGQNAEAQAAFDKLKGGAKFEDVAKENKLEIADLGALAKKDFIDPTVAEAAFKAKAGEYAGPVNGQFGPVVLRVSKVEAESTKPFDEVKAEIKADLALKKAQEEVRTIYNKIEDQRTSGKVLEEAAKSIGQKVRVIEAIDANGRDKKGEPVGDIVEQKQLLQSAFASDIGVDNETLTIPSGGYLWFEVAAIDEARDRKLDEVKESVETAWRNAEISKRLREKGEALVKEIEGGKAIAEVAKGAGLQIQNAPDVKRTSHPKLAPAVVNRIFSLPVGSTGTAPGNAGDRVVFKIVDASTPPLVDKSEELERIEKQLESAYQQELTEEYVAQLRRGVTITYNPAAIRNVVGGEEN